MWWLRELRYSIVGKIIMLTVAIAIVAGLGLVGYNAYSNQTVEDLEPAAAVETTAEAEARKAKTGRELRCESVKGRLQRLVEQTGRFSSVNSAQSNSAFEAYAEAVRTCTYNEFAEFEREVLIPWTAGQDMFTAVQESGDLGSPTESTTPEETK